MVVRRERQKSAVSRNLGYNEFGAIKEGGVESLISLQFRIALNEDKMKLMKPKLISKSVGIEDNITVYY
jgi:hypothetical protein